MREGKYWFNLMTEDEQINWYRDWDGWSVTCDFTKIYDNFEEFIKNTVMQQSALVGCYCQIFWP